MRCFVETVVTADWCTSQTQTITAQAYLDG